MSVVGIDFGSDTVVVAVARRKAIDVVMNDLSKRATPAMVGYSSKERLMGEQAKSGHRTNLKNTVTEVTKCDLGFFLKTNL